MRVEEVMKELEGFGNPGTKKVLMKHGAQEPFFGVKVGDMKKIVKKIKKNHELSLELYDTGNSDAMYLAGLIADEHKISKKELNDWLKKAYWHMLSEYTVPWIASESPYGFELAKKWITSKDEKIASAGWACLSSLLSIKPDEELDIPFMEEQMDFIADHIHQAPNRVRYTMNGFVISAGSFVASLTKKAKAVAKKIGKVDVEMGGTACKVPLAETYIQKVVDANRIGKKRKMARC